MILWSFQGICQDHQASLHSAIQPLHPECGCSKRHSQHQQRGGGASTWPRHHRWRPLSAEQAAGRLTDPHSSRHYPPAVHRCLLCRPQAPLYTAYVSPFVSTVNVLCFFGKSLCCPHCMAYGLYNLRRHISLATDIGKLHKPKELFNPGYCFA